jgi:hypothetical protein
MNQVPRRTRVRQLAESVWPGRTVNGYANLIGARLRKLAEEGSTGMLPVSGHGDGAVFFRGGAVVYAESSRTPLPAFRASGLAALGLAEIPEPPAGGHAGQGDLVTARSVAKLAGTLAVTEAVIDAVTDLLSSDSRYAKFRHSDDPPAAQVRPIPVEALLSEVQRRQRVLRQLAAVITPDTEIARQPALDSASAQVSPSQWALLVRAGGGATPRDLAAHLGRSVFGTTIEVYRLVDVGLLAVPGRPAPSAGGPDTRRAGPAMSFIRALSGERGSDG